VRIGVLRFEQSFACGVIMKTSLRTLTSTAFQLLYGKRSYSIWIGQIARVLAVEQQENLSGQLKLEQRSTVLYVSKIDWMIIMNKKT
jgi:hypothetical protein